MSDEETTEETKVEEKAEEKPEEEVKPAPVEQLKIVINLRDDKLMVGVQSPDCDPVYTTLKGTLAAALKQIPKLVKDAKEKWSDNPRYPEANLPKPEPLPAPARTTSAPKKAKKKEQPRFF